MKHLVVPITDLDAPDRQAIAHAGSVRRHGEAVLAVHVLTDVSALDALRAAWVAVPADAQLIVLEASSSTQAPERRTDPLVAYVKALSVSAPVTVIVPADRRGDRAPSHAEISAAFATHPRVDVATASSVTGRFPPT